MDANPVPAGDDTWAETKDPLPAPKVIGPGVWLLAVAEEDVPLKPKMPLPVLEILEDVPSRGWLLAFEVEPFNPKMPIPVFVVAGDVQPKEALVRLPKVVPCLMLVSLSLDSTPEVASTEEAAVNGATEEPNVKRDGEENEGAAAVDTERLLPWLVVETVAEEEAFAAVAALRVELLETL